MGLEEAKVYSPSGGDNPFQLGQTDVHGRFSFVPDAPGLWRVVVKDGLGHVAEAAVEIDDAFISGAAGAKVAHSGPTAISGIQKLSLALTGLALIITLAALVLTLRRLKRRG